MFLEGSKAIDYLAEQAIKEDPGASSHWRLFHSNFSFVDGKLDGIQGFGGNRKPYTGIYKWMNQILQKPYRNLVSNNLHFNQIDQSAKIITSNQNRAYDLDVLRQSITLAFLKSQCPDYLNENSTVWVIGDGFASMTSLLLANKLAKRVVLVNLTKTLLVDLYYLRLWLGKNKFDKIGHLFLDSSTKEGALIGNSDLEFEVVAIQAKDYKLLSNFKADLVINIASMQEMDNKYIDNYFSEIRKACEKNQVLFYCCNREEKLLPDGNFTKIDDYPWTSKDNIFLKERCPWHQKYYEFSLPIYKNYDGPIQHRIVEMAKN